MTAFSNKPVPNQSLRRYLKNLLKNYSRTENFKSIKWRLTNNIPELLELGIVATYWDVQRFVKISTKNNINFTRILFKLGRVAKKKNAFIVLNYIEFYVLCGYCYFFQKDGKFYTFHQLLSIEPSIRKYITKITKINEIPFVILDKITIHGKTYEKPFALN